MLVFLIPFIVYLPTLSGTFYYDDNVIFFGHQVKHLAENPFLVFNKDVHFLPGAGRSLHVFFLLILYKVFGVSALPYHIFNLIFHSLTSLLIFIFMKRITGKPELALLAGLIFGLHPVHVENITFVTLGGTDLFYAFFAMLSIVCYVLFRDCLLKGWKNLILLGLSALAYFFSILSKESASAFIVIFPLTELFLGRRGFLWALPHLAVLLFMKWGFLLGSASMAVSGISSGKEQARGIEEVLLSLGLFIKSLILPYPLSPFIKDFGSKTILYSFLILSGVLFIAGIAMRKRLFIYGTIWLLLTSIPYLFVPFIESNVAISAERYIYAPSIGFSIMLASALIWLSERRKIIRLLSLAILIAYSVIGVNYFFKAWRSEEAFWRYAVKMNPDYVSGYISLAGIKLDKGNISEGYALIVEGLSKPKGMPAEFAQAAYILGNIALQTGDLGRAESYYQLSLRYAPYEFSFIELGYLYLNTGNPERAKWAFENAMNFSQQNMRAVYGLAKSYELMGDRNTAKIYALRVYEHARDERLKAMAAEILRGSVTRGH